MDVDVSTSVAGNKPQRIRRIQTVTLVLLFMAGIVNFLDRSSLSVAGEAIRGELGLSATEFGVLLSAFSLSYGFSGYQVELKETFLVYTVLRVAC